MHPRRRAIWGGVPPEEQPYWRGQVSPYQRLEEYRQERTLQRELRDQVEQLTGLAIDNEDSAYQICTRLGFLPTEKAAAALRIEQDYADLQSEAQADSLISRLPEDAEKLRLLEREKRADLAAALSPAELELYDLNTSPTSFTVRYRMAGLRPTEEEFRAVFALQRTYDETYDTQLPSTTPPDAQARAAAQKQLDEQIRSALGDARYAEFERGQNIEYQTSVRIARHFNLPEQNAVAVYELSRAAQRQTDSRTRTGPTTMEGQLAAISQQLQEVRDKLTPLLTAEGVDALQQVRGSWLNLLGERQQMMELTARRRAETKARGGPGGG